MTDTPDMADTLTPSPCYLIIGGEIRKVQIESMAPVKMFPDATRYAIKQAGPCLTGTGFNETLVRILQEQSSRDALEKLRVLQGEFSWTPTPSEKTTFQDGFAVRLERVTRHIKNVGSATLGHFVVTASLEWLEREAQRLSLPNPQVFNLPYVEQLSVWPDLVKTLLTRGLEPKKVVEEAEKVDPANRAEPGVAKTYTRIHAGGSSSTDLYLQDDGSYRVSDYGSGSMSLVTWEDESGSLVPRGTSLWHRLESEFLLEAEKGGQIKSPQNDDISVPGDPSRGIL